MPTYDYECDACGYTWELFQKITDNPVKKCPDCSKRKARRLFGTGAAVVFKGSGFYQTDYRSDSYKKAADADKKKDSGPKTSSNEKSPTGASPAKTESPSSKGKSKKSDS